MKKIYYTITVVIMSIITINAHANQNQITVIMDHAKVIKLEQEAQSIIIGNPHVVDATVQDNQTLILTGKSFGTTNLIALNENGDTVYNKNVVVQTHGENLVRIYRRAERQTLACAPVCENTVSLGDNNIVFQGIIEQIERRNTISTPNRLNR